MQAEILAEAFVYNMDTLVTKDYLDARLDMRFAEQDARLETRLLEQDSRNNLRFSRLEEKLDGQEQKFTGIDKNFAIIGQKFAAMDVQFAEIKGRFMVQDWILGAIAACTVVPPLYGLFNP